LFDRAAGPAQVEVLQVWKKFRRGRLHDSLRDLIPAAFRSLLPGKTRQPVLAGGEFWAVRNVSFRVGPGDVLGIVGHNGAGKSTVLKLLTRVLRPTRGYCRLTGRVGALVEIASGFHPDLTGRENVQLQGAIMGMSRADIVRRFDEIIAFSGIEEFIDTPVKRYSSGMYARLGFAIAAHLDPDVLIIDEVLAVGDVAFQAKAFARVRDLARSGRPVVVVSHQLPRIEELCTRAMLLDHGTVLYEGSARECVAKYLRDVDQGPKLVAEDSPVTIESLVIQNGDLIRSGEVLHVNIKGQLARAAVADDVEPVAILLRHAETGMVCSLMGTRDFGLTFPAGGAFSLDVALQMNVAPGLYSLQTVGWDKTREVAISGGPVAAVLVREGRSFLGLVQLNATMAFSPPSAGGC
jgi:ABC-type polysaccharide/polyol phosphate transport system ATPase subunit